MFKIIIFVFLVLATIGGVVVYNTFVSMRITNTPQNVFSISTSSPQTFEGALPLTSFVNNRNTIWAMDFFPDGRMLFTERNGNVNVVGKDGQVQTIFTADVQAQGESGLHGIAIDPNFEDNNFVYLYYTYSSQGETTYNRVSRYTFGDASLSNEEIIVDSIPGASTHDGGRLKFGPDGFLYITTGDAQEPSASQDTNSLAGKILRVTRDGEPAPGNPFNNEIYSYGHRNPQGITWDADGGLWATEHGPSARDELNRIEMGANYGWPTITGDDTQADMRTPIIHSGGGTWAPGGAAHHNGIIYFGGLRGSALYAYNIDTNELQTYLKNNFGRIRDVIVGPDDFLYIATSNRDGRGVPSGDDDRILKINPLKIDEI